MNLPPATYRSIHRCLDCLLAGGTLLVSTPLLVGIGVLLKLEGTTPVLFKQLRVGKDGRPFYMYKFRTLKTSEDANGAPRDIATRIGGWLRRYALDELPQLWNVLRGEMSMIGPRPTLPEQVERYGAFERRRLEVKPGLTGWAQVNGRNSLPWSDRIRLDVWYVDNRSFQVDLAILARTPLQLLKVTDVYSSNGTNYDFNPSVHD